MQGTLSVSSLSLPSPYFPRATSPFSRRVRGPYSTKREKRPVWKTHEGGAHVTARSYALAIVTRVIQADENSNAWQSGT